MKIKKTIITIILLIFIEYGYSQSTFENKKEQVYTQLIDSIKSDYPDVLINFNLQTKVKVPIKKTAPGVLKSVILESSISQDSTIFSSINLKISSDFISLSNLEDDEMVAKVCGLCKKKLFVNIYEPLDFWLNYYFVLLTSDEYHPLSFNKVYLPVKFSMLNNEKEALTYFIKIYIYDINGEVPILLDVLSQ